MPITRTQKGTFFNTRRTLAAIAALFFNVLLASTPSFGNTVFQEKFTQALSPELRVIYSEAIAAFQAEDFKSANQKYSDLHEKGLATRDDLAVGLGLAGLAEIQVVSKNYGFAEKSLTKALPFIARSGMKELEAWTHAEMGRIHLQLKKPQEAIDAFREALSIAETFLPKASDIEKLTIVSARADVLFAKAAAHAELAEFGDAVNALLQAGEDFESVGEKAMAASSYRYAGAILLNRSKEPSKALPVSEKATKLFIETKDHKGLVETRLDMAAAYRELGGRENFEIVAKLLEEVIDSAKQTGDEKLVATVHLELAEFYAQLQAFDKALAHSQTGFAHYRQVAGGEYSDPNYYSYLYSQAGIYRHLSRYEEAIEILLALLPVSQERGWDEFEAVVLKVLADISAWITDYGRAIQYYKQSLELFKKRGDTFRQISVLSSLGELRIGGVISATEAAAYFETAMKLLNTFEQKLSSFEPQTIMVAGNLYQRWGRIAVISGEIDDAIQRLEVALSYHQSLPFDISVRSEQAKDLYILGEAYRKKQDFKKSLEYFRACEDLARELSTPEIHWVYAGLAHTYAALGDNRSAIEHYKKGLVGLESIQGQQVVEERKIGVIANAIDAYRGLVPLLLDSYRTTGNEQYLADAFEYTERLKARAFREMYSVSRAARVGGDFGGMAAKEEKIRIEMRSVNERLQKARVGSAEGSRLLDRLEELRKSLSELRQEAAKENKPLAQVFAGDPVTLTEVQNGIPADSVLLEYSISGQQITVWAITKETAGYAVIDVVDETVLEAYLKTLRVPLFDAKDISNHVSLGKKLYQTLFGKVEHYVRGKNQLIISPDGPLYYLPFETLIETGAQKDTPNYTTLANVPYLIKQYQVSYIPSASVFVAQNSQERKQKNPLRLPLVAFGDPVYGDESARKIAVVDSRRISNVALGGSNFQRLEFSGEEVRRIAGIWNVAQDSEHVNLRQQASVNRVREMDLSKYRMVHFASHAVLGDKVGLASQPALILSENDGKDAGLLQFSDILELKLNADLVVLSACETGLGQLHDGEGIVGITRAFFYAGASSAVVSLWKVQDQSTSIFMESFYKRLKQGKSKAEALREAKIEMMKTTVDKYKATDSRQSLAAPFFWAPFILTGDSGPIVN
jgi:CHAT domain-containing protein/predicted negative regulator of RcsB-dependent stress response